MDTLCRPAADEVLAYLVEHPQAQDTIEGIVRWWLSEQTIRYGVADVEVALSGLVGHDLLRIEPSQRTRDPTALEDCKSGGRNKPGFNRAAGLSP
jgi:hypothetical protein